MTQQFGEAAGGVFVERETLSQAQAHAVPPQPMSSPNEG